MNIPKCPNCGSTAQVKKNIPHTTTTGEYINMQYVCGCGCYFDDPCMVELEKLVEGIEKLVEISREALTRLKNI